MSLLTFLYTASSFCVALSFIPQILTLMKDRSGAEAINLGTVTVWDAASIIALIYAIVVVGDSSFIMVSLVFAFGNTAILTLALFNRFFRARGLASIPVKQHQQARK